MAAPITHIVLAKEFLRCYSVAGNASDFVVGTSFPDIRYLGVITRERTHRTDINLNDILNTSNAFEAGMQHHVLVDIVREKFVQSRGVYGFASKSEYITQALKFFEDDRLYTRLNDWNVTIGYLKNILVQEVQFPIARDDISRWHDLLSEYVRDAPSSYTRRKFILGIGFRIEIADEIERIIEELRENAEVTAIVDDGYKNFTSLMTS